MMLAGAGGQVPKHAREALAGIGVNNG